MDHHHVPARAGTRLAALAVTAAVALAAGVGAVGAPAAAGAATPDDGGAPSPGDPAGAPEPTPGPDPVWRHATPADRVPDIVAAARPGESVVLDPGVYPNILLEDLHTPGVTLRGLDRAGVVVQGLQVRDSSGLTISSMTVTSSPIIRSSAVRLQGTSHDVVLTELTLAPTRAKGVDITDQVHHVTVDNVLIDGAAVHDGTGRGFYLEGGGGPDDWPHDVTVRNSRIVHAEIDAVFIAGGRAVTITDDYLLDLQDNPAHNDGVQVVAGVRVAITRNEITSPGPVMQPDQAIILGADAGVADRPIEDTTIADNLIRDWRGTGIIVAGARGTAIVNNSIARTGSATFAGASVASVERPGLDNPGLRVWNNVLDSLNDGAGGFAYEDFNCVARGGRGDHDVADGPEYRDVWTLELDPSSACAQRAGAWREGTPLVDFAGLDRSDRPVSLGAWR